MTDIEGIPKEEIVAALHNYRCQKTTIFILYPMTRDMAKDVLKEGMWIDHLKVDIRGSLMYTFLYNRECGEDAAEKLIANLRKRFPCILPSSTS